MTKKSILYISGEGHSGTTLLDIILGNQKNTFSAGELIFLPNKGIENGEYCACGRPVPECMVWREIISTWNENRTLDLEQYGQIRKKLVSKTKLISAQKLLRNPPQNVKDFIFDTEQLYRAIFDVTNSNCIVDSSKAPGMIPILKKLNIDVTVIHIKRRFGDVLNSYKVHLKQNLKAGVEHEIKPRKTSYIMRSWLIKNLLSRQLSKGLHYKQIKYEDLIDNLDGEILKITSCSGEYLQKLKNRGPFYPNHLVAGSTIRMKDELFVAKKPMDTSYHRLNNKDKLTAKLIDAFY